MNRYWQHTFQKRIDDFVAHKSLADDEVPMSIKIRVTSGCFHREHSPRAYDIIDRYLASLSQDQQIFVFEEHESGPEILVYLAVTTAGITIAKSVIDLITTIIKARTEGIQQGDHPHDALRIIIRRTTKNGKFQEGEVLRFDTKDVVDEIIIEESLEKASRRLLEEELPKTITNDNSHHSIDPLQDSEQ